MTNYTEKRYVVRHKRSIDSTYRQVACFATEGEALAEYEELSRTYRRERVWVIDLRNGQLIADSHPCTRR